MLYPGNYTDKTFHHYIRAMFRHTHNGWLTIRKSDYVVQANKMRWTEQDVEPLVRQLEEFLENLDRIALVYDQLGATKEENKALLPPPLLEIWYTFVRKVRVEGFDTERIDQLSNQTQPLTQQEQALLDGYEAALEQAALERLPAGGIPSYKVLRRCWRYTRLISLNAPRIIVNNEARMLAETLTLYAFAVPETNT